MTNKASSNLQRKAEVKPQIQKQGWPGTDGRQDADVTKNACEKAEDRRPLNQMLDANDSNAGRKTVARPGRNGSQ